MDNPPSPDPLGCSELTVGIGQITSGLIVEPLALDLVAGNMIAKQLIYLAGADAAGLVLGARVPVILTSRADGLLSRLASSALAQLFIHHRQE